MPAHALCCMRCPVASGAAFDHVSFECLSNVPPRLVEALGADPLSLQHGARLAVASDVITNARHELSSGLAIKVKIDTYDELAAQKQLSNLRNFAFHGKCWWAWLEEHVCDERWSTLTPPQQWELADVRAEYVAYSQLGDGLLYVPSDFSDLRCPRLVARGVSESTFGNWLKTRLAVNVSKRIRQLNARASGRIVRLDFTARAAKALGARWLLTIVGEDGQVLGMKAGDSTDIEDYADYLKQLSSADNYTAEILFIGEERPARLCSAGARAYALRLTASGLRPVVLPCSHSRSHPPPPPPRGCAHASHRCHCCTRRLAPQTTCRQDTRTARNTSRGSSSCSG